MIGALSAGRMPAQTCYRPIQRSRQLTRCKALHGPELHTLLQHLSTLAQIPTNAATASNVGQNASLLGGAKEVS